ncbi:MAG: CHAT domain-containing protein [Caldilineales bacterium]
MTPLTHADLEIRILERKEAGYPVELSLNQQRMFRGGFISPEIAKWTPPRLDAEAGRELFSLLVQDPMVRSAWDMIRGARPQRRIRLSIDTTAPELYAVPWELMQEVDDNGLGISLAAGDATPFSRYIALSQDYGEPVRAYPLKIAVAIASPANLSDYPGDLVRIDPEQEWNAIQEVVDGLPVELIRIPQPCTLEAIDAALGNGAHVLHLVAHGALSRQGRAVILLANRNNQVRHVYADEHASLLALHARDTASRPDALRLIFMASCQSATADPTDAFRSFAPRLVQAGVPAVLAMQDLVPINTARAFTQAFYRQLLRHGEVDLACNQARAALLSGQWPAAHVPVLFMRLTDGRLLASNPARTALENILADPRFNFFDPAKGKYIPLPVEAVHITGHQDVSQFQAAAGESTASIDIWDALEEVLDRHVPHDDHADAPRVLALLGGYGSNRGTQLKRIVWNTARMSFDAGEAAFVLPVYVDLETMPSTALGDNDLIEKLVAQTLERFWPGATGAISDLLAGHEPLLRFVFNTDDSLPEQEQDAWISRIRTFINSYPQHQYVVGANLETFDSVWFTGLDQHLLILQPMSRRRIRHFLQHLPADDRGGLPLLERLDLYGIYDLAAVPWFMVKLLDHARAGTYPESRTQMLGKIVEDAVTGTVDRMISSSQAPTLNRQGLRSHIDQILNKLAWQMQSGRARQLSLADAFAVMKEVRGDREYSLERMVEALIANRLLTTYGVDSLRFAYSRIQAHCCARNRRPPRPGSDAGRHHLDPGTPLPAALVGGNAGLQRRPAGRRRRCDRAVP